MSLKYVTITGTDDNVNPSDLLELSREYPFVEWGILVSKTREGKEPRYPSRDWIRELRRKSIENRNPSFSQPGINVSVHICGSWVRTIMGDSGSLQEVLNEMPPEIMYARRMQWNYHNRKDPVIDFEKIYDFVDHIHYGSDTAPMIILPVGTETKIVEDFWGREIPVYPLFDRSGGNGILPDSWPQRIHDPERPYTLMGYAGGLNPDNLREQLPRIVRANDSGRHKRSFALPYWIDMEAGVRNPGDDTLNLDKVESVLKQVVAMTKDRQYDPEFARFFVWVVACCDELKVPRTWGENLMPQVDPSWFFAFDDKLTPEEAVTKFQKSFPNFDPEVSLEYPA